MTIETVRDFFLWSTLIHFAILLCWFLGFWIAHDWMHRAHDRWFRLSVQQFDSIHYAGMAIYKIGIILFGLVPYVVLQLIG